ncbi:hypothetical protein LIS04_120 [Listeria phage LIS04]|nr:hypothetical protein LIS04_120 [Listeria phage LIS04]
MFNLDPDWLIENYEVGSISSTSVGDTVWVKGYDHVDEVLFPYEVLEVNSDHLVAVESNPTYSIPPLERGLKIVDAWFVKKESN